MKRGIKTSFEILILITLLMPFFSAEIIFTEPIKPVYNLGDIIYVPVTIKTLTDASGVFKMDLICNSTLINFYMNGVKLLAGDEKRMDSSLVLISKIIKGNHGLCRIKASLNEDYQLSDEFKISDYLNVIGEIDKTEYNSGEKILITGTVEKEGGEYSNGFIDAYLTTNNINENLTQTGTINKGVISMDLSLPENLKAGSYFLKINAYEKDSEGTITNTGYAEYNFSVNQVPTNLEMIIENKQLNPGEILRVKAILHDQTGNSIPAKVYITIKNQEGKIIEQDETDTDLFLEYSIFNNEPPAEWQIYAISKRLEVENTFTINKKESASIDVFNNTIVVTNNGNVFYNKTILIKVGETPLNIQAELNVGETKRYTLSAPDGEYKVRITTQEGDEITKTLGLTGNAISVNDNSVINLSILGYISLVIVGFGILFFLVKRHKKRKMMGVKPSRGIIPSFGFKKKEIKSLPTMREDSISRTVNNAELSLTIKGNKQEVSVVCLKIKNVEEMDSKGSASDTLEKLKHIAEENKAVVYDNQDYLLFFIIPSITKTFKNEVIALDLAEKIQRVLSEHNRMFNQKIDFGISLNKGELIGKIEDDTFKFMGIGSWMTLSKRFASLSNEEVILTEKINDLLRVTARTEKEVREGTPIYVLKSIKRENEDARKFINKFMDRQSKE